MTNSYDTDDIVRRDYVLYAGPLKYAIYRVRLPDGEYTEPQHHFTHDNIILANMPESVVENFIDFYDDISTSDSFILESDLHAKSGGQRFFAGRRAPQDGETYGSIYYAAFYHDMCLGVLGAESAKLLVRMARAAKTRKDATQTEEARG